MLTLTAQELRQKWIDFFKASGHTYFPPASVVPEKDKSLLFINSGVAAIKEYFVGDKTVESKRIVNCQKVVRTNDIENIGHSTRHHTFFEMLGNFSIGDYFKAEAIKFAYSFLVEELAIPLDKLYFTVFDEDEETLEIYKTLSIGEDRIIKCGRDRNFWDMGCGPCGPCTEIYYDRGYKFDKDKKGIQLLRDDIENERYLEIWNIVFSEFINENGNIKPAISKNIDTGCGLERLLTILEKKSSNFENSLFLPIIKSIESFTVHKYLKLSATQIELKNYFKIVADHLRAVIMLLNDGVLFANKDKGYVLRKLFRRCLLASNLLGVDSKFLAPTINVVIGTLSSYHETLIDDQNLILESLNKEADAFDLILEKSKFYIDDLVGKSETIDLPSEIFTLVERYGIPYDLIKDILATKSISFDEKKYQELFDNHRQASQNKTFTNPFEGFIATAPTTSKNPTNFIYNQLELIDAEIVEIFDEHQQPITSLNNQKGFLLFNKTIFFSGAAGQVKDEGTINDKEVIYLHKNQRQQILHFVAESTLQVGHKVTMKVDGTKRLQVSQQHTAEHLVYAHLQQIVHPKVYRESAKKHFANFSILVSTPEEITSVDIEQLEVAIKKDIVDNIIIKSWNTDAKSASDLGLDVSKLTTKNKDENIFRIVKMGGISTELCIGTHVSSGAELEEFLLFEWSKKGVQLYEIKGVAGKQKVCDHLTQEQETFSNDSQEAINKLEMSIKQIVDNHGKPLAILENKLQHYKKLQKQLMDGFFTFNLLKLYAEIDAYFLALNNWKKEIEQQINHVAFTKLKLIIEKASVEPFVTLEINDYKQKELQHFLKSFKLQSNVVNLIIFNKSDGKSQFYIIGQTESSQKIFEFLKTSCGAFGGGASMISGNLNKSSFSLSEASTKTMEFIKSL